MVGSKNLLNVQDDDLVFRNGYSGDYKLEDIKKAQILINGDYNFKRYDTRVNCEEVPDIAFRSAYNFEKTFSPLRASRPLSFVSSISSYNPIKFDVRDRSIRNIGGEEQREEKGDYFVSEEDYKLLLHIKNMRADHGSSETRTLKSPKRNSWFEKRWENEVALSYQDGLGRNNTSSPDLDRTRQGSNMITSSDYVMEEASPVATSFNSTNPSSLHSDAVWGKTDCEEKLKSLQINSAGLYNNDSTDIPRPDETDESFLCIKRVTQDVMLPRSLKYVGKHTTRSSQSTDKCRDEQDVDLSLDKNFKFGKATETIGGNTDSKDCINESNSSENTKFIKKHRLATSVKKIHSDELKTHENSKDTNKNPSLGSSKKSFHISYLDSLQKNPITRTDPYYDTIQTPNKFYNKESKSASVSNTNHSSQTHSSISKDQNIRVDCGRYKGYSNSILKRELSTMQQTSLKDKNLVFKNTNKRAGPVSSALKTTGTPMYQAVKGSLPSISAKTKTSTSNQFEQELESNLADTLKKIQLNKIEIPKKKLPPSTNKADLYVPKLRSPVKVHETRSEEQFNPPELKPVSPIKKRDSSLPEAIKIKKNLKPANLSISPEPSFDSNTSQKLINLNKTPPSPKKIEPVPEALEQAKKLHKPEPLPPKAQLIPEALQRATQLNKTVPSAKRVPSLPEALKKAIELQANKKRVPHHHTDPIIT